MAVIAYQKRDYSISEEAFERSMLISTTAQSSYNLATARTLVALQSPEPTRRELLESARALYQKSLKDRPSQRTENNLQIVNSLLESTGENLAP